jgi:DNA-binding GntR family transcriptional regulator
MVQTILSPVSSPLSLEKRAYDSLKDAILTFRLKPGQSLVENDLARQLNISKTPVRDALLKLEKEGFVNKVPYTGTYVAEINPQMVMDIFEIRAVLEGLAARLATPLITDEQIAEMQQSIYQHHTAAAENNIQQAAVLNKNFHDWIIHCASNPWLRQILDNLDDHLQRYRTLSNFQTGRLDKSVEEHQHVLDAFRSKDADAAEKFLRDHILSVRTDLATQDFHELIARIDQTRLPI